MKLRRPTLHLSVLVLLFFFGQPAGGSQTRPDPQQIIERFAAKESEFQKVWNQYTYTQNLTVEVLNRQGNVAEQKEMVIEVFFDTKGKRKTRIVKERGELFSVQMTEQDLHDAIELQPFVLTKEELPKYDIKFKGEEWVDEINTYVFDVKPKKKREGERYFKGRIWVDDLEFQIVKTKGKIVPDLENNKFPEFVSIRQQVDGKYWFPVWIKADDHLTFGNFFNRRTVHIREWITLKNFQRFEVDTRIQFEDLDSKEEKQPPR